MKPTYFKNLIACLLCFFAITLVLAQKTTDDFVTTWKTDNPGGTITQISIRTYPYGGLTYNYDVDWDNDGVFDEFGFTGVANHDYETPGTYTVRVRGRFPQFFMNDHSANRQKLLSVDQWGTGEWVSMVRAFFGCTNLEILATDAPNLSHVTDMGLMFFNAQSINQNIGHWDVSNVTNMSGLFRSARTFNQDISAWDMRKVTSASQMFNGAIAFNKDISAWQTDQLEDAYRMFRGATLFNQDISSWNMSLVSDCYQMLQNTTNFNQNLSAWDISSLERAKEMFNGSNLSDENYNALLKGWGTLDTDSGETNIPSFVNLGAPNQYCSAIAERTILTQTYDWIINDLGSSCSNSFISTWQTASDNESVTIPTSGNGYNYTVDWGDGTTSSHADGDLTTDATHSYVTTGTYDVQISGDFPRIYFNNTGDKEKIRTIEQWGTFAWTSMENAFKGCSNLEMNAVDTPNLSGLINLDGMFDGIKALTKNIGHWDISLVESMNGMFNNVVLATNIYDNLLISWSSLPSLQDDVVFTAGTQSHYCAGEDARSLLSTNYSWSIIDANIPSCSDSFVTTWQTTNANQSITIPTLGIGYLYTIDWGDGSKDTGLTGSASHSYTNAGTYTVSISGKFPRIYFLNQDDLYTVEQWGTSKWFTMENAFENCDNVVINAPDVPDLSIATNMNRMFKGATSLNQSLNSWDVSTITSMEEVFVDATAFNGDISSWNVSNVETMYAMFYGAEVFNQNIGSWNVAKVTNMEELFYEATAFNQYIGDWDISSVESTYEMFYDAINFNQNIGSWDMSNVTDMSEMFYGAAAFDQYIGDWNTTNVESTYEMFYEALNFNQDIDDWDVSNVTDMSQMFYGATKFNKNIGSWNVSNVEDMNHMFYDADAFNSPINNWNVGKVTNMNYMFSETDGFNQPIDSWNVSSVTKMDGMFSDASAFNQPLNSWDVSNVKIMSNMFSSTSAFNQPLDAWNVSNVTDFGNMFGASVNFNQPLNNWDLSSATNLSAMFYDATAFDRPLGNWDMSDVEFMDEMFENVTLSTVNYDAILIGWSTLGPNETEIPTDITFSAGNSTFCNGAQAKASLEALSWTIFDGGQVCTTGNYFVTTWLVEENETITIPTHPDEAYQYDIDWDYDGISFNADVKAATGNSTSGLLVAGSHTVAIRGNFPRIYFEGAVDKNKLQTVHQWGTQSWTSMESAFKSCENFNITNPTIDIPNLSNVTDMNEMFQGTSKFNGDINSWDVSHVTNMNQMFFFTQAFNSPLNNWDVSKVEDMGYMFAACDLFNQALNDWDVSSVQNMEQMFSYAYAFNQPLDKWDVGNVTNTSTMFNEAIAFNQNLNTWDVSNVENMAYMFNASAFNSPLNNWNTGKVTNMRYIFAYSSVFDQSLSNWDLSSAPNMNGMFSNTTLSTANYDDTLSGWNTDSSGDLDDDIDDIPESIEFHGGNSKYCMTGETAKIDLIDNYGWNNFADGGKDTDENCQTLSFENETAQIFTVYPNPTTSKLFISTPLNIQLKSISIHDVSGRTIWTKTIKTNTLEHSINVNNLPSGMYLLTLKSDTENVIKRIVKE